VNHHFFCDLISIIFLESGSSNDLAALKSRKLKANKIMDKRITYFIF